MIRTAPTSVTKNIMAYICRNPLDFKSRIIILLTQKKIYSNYLHSQT